MKKLSFHDVERLSTYLDGQLSPGDAARLAAELARDPERRAVLADLRLAQQALRRLPVRRVPRSFTLRPGMAGLRPPVPRAVPALSWASAAAVLLFVGTLGVNLLGSLSFGAAAPMMMAAQESTGYGMGGGPVATEAPAALDAAPLPTGTEAPVALVGAAPEAPPEASADASTRSLPPSEETAPKQPVHPWLWIGPVLAGALLAAALAVRLVSLQAFRRRNPPRP